MTLEPEVAALLDLIKASGRPALDSLPPPEARLAYAKLLKQGWTDALRKLNPHERLYTFWDFRRAFDSISRNPNNRLALQIIVYRLSAHR